MRKSIMIGSDRDLRSWLFEAEEAPAGAAPAGAAPAGGDKKEVGPDAVSAEEIQKLWALPYTAFVERLKVIAKDPKLHAFLAAGKKDGAPDDESITASPATIAAKSLSPTQSEIDLSNSVTWSFKNPDSIGAFYSGGAWQGGDPIITAGGKFIIDGHHRWSSAIIFNPEIQLNCINIDIDDAEMALKMTQAAIAVTKNDVPTQGVKEGMNIYKMGFAAILASFAQMGGGAFLPMEAVKQLQGKLESTATPDEIKQAGRFNVSSTAQTKTVKVNKAGGKATLGNPTPGDYEEMNQALKEQLDFGNMFAGQGAVGGVDVGQGTIKTGIPPEQAWPQVAASLAHNCKTLPAAGQFPRPFMPQTSVRDGGPGPEGLVAALKDGEINSDKPFDIVKEGRLVYGFERRSSLPGIRRRY